MRPSQAHTNTGPVMVRKVQERIHVLIKRLVAASQRRLVVPFLTLKQFEAALSSVDTASKQLLSHKRSAWGS